MARTFKPDEVTFTITAEQDDLPIRGNAIVSGDDDYDELVACGIEADLDAGNEWAWASVKVSASWAGFTGNDYMGGCSYKDEAGFREGGYLPQMLEGGRGRPPPPDQGSRVGRHLHGGRGGGRHRTGDRQGESSMTHNLTKIHVDLPNSPMCGGESLWASPIDGEPEHFKLENIPYFTYGLAIGDVVRAVETAEHPREVVSVVRPSGNRTLRVAFTDKATEDSAKAVIEDLCARFEVKVERGMGVLWAVSVPPEADYEECCDVLRGAAVEDGILDFECGDSFEDGSFDARPEDRGE